MRYHEPFTVFPRTLSSGRVVWYYRAYDESRPQNRTPAYSTGATTKTSARAHCRKLQDRGELIPEPGGPRTGPPSFGAFARDFWTWGHSPYIEARLRFSDPQQPAVSRRHADDMASVLRQHVMPAFGRRRLDSITPTQVETFALRLRDGGLSGKRVNNVVSCLRTILAEAHRAGLLAFDPMRKGVIRAVGTVPKERGRLTLDEVARLFDEEAISTAWKGHLLYRAVNLTAAATGMRQGEILAVRDEDVRDDHVHVAHSWSPRYGLGPTKTRQVRDVPLPPRMLQAIAPFCGTGGFVFSMNGGDSPCTGNRATEALYTGLAAIGVTDRAERNVTFHSWRHWLNTVLRARGVPDDLIRRVVGHGTAAMTDRYTVYLAEDFHAVATAQQEVFA